MKGMLAAPSNEQRRLMKMAFAEAADVEDEFLQEKQQVAQVVRITTTAERVLLP